MAGDNISIFPGTVLIDTREQAPFHFRGITQQGTPLVIRTETVGMTTGDYSLAGFQDRFAIERKSLPDLFHCCGSDRSRFEEQVKRLADLDFAAGGIEGDELAIRRFGIGGETRMNSRAVISTIDSWEQRHGVHFWLCVSRAHAEAKTFRAIRQWWRQHGNEADG